MLRRGTQRVLVGQGGICRIILCRDAAVVPQAQNAAHRNVYGAVCSFVCDPAKLQKRYNIAIYLDGGLSRIVVYGFQIVYAVVAVVYIVKPMQSCKLFCDRLRFFIKTFFIGVPARDDGLRVKKGHVGRRKLFQSAAAGKRQRCRKQRYEKKCR